MFCKVYGMGLLGVEGHLIQVEVDVSDGLPSFSMVGALASEVREAQDRIKTALRNSGSFSGEKGDSKFISRRSSKKWNRI